MSTELTALPESFAAGTTVTYRKQLTDYPASDGWSFTLYLAGAQVAQVAAAADDDDFVVTVGATITDGITAGLYKYAERVSKDGAVYEVESGVVTILPDLTKATDTSEQEWIEKAVAALRAHIEGRLPTGMESYSIAGRAVSRMPLAEALEWLDKLEARLSRMKSPGSMSDTVFIEFPKPGWET